MGKTSSNPRVKIVHNWRSQASVSGSASGSALGSSAPLMAVLDIAGSSNSSWEYVGKDYMGLSENSVPLPI